MYMMMRNPAQLLFLFTTVALAYLVLPPFFFILHTSLVSDRGLQAGSFTIEHFANIIDSLGDVKTLLWNSMVFSIGSSAVALAYGTTLAWLAERSDAPFRKLAYISAYVSFAIPGIIKVIGWIMLLGPKAGLLNAVGMALVGTPFLIFLRSAAWCWSKAFCGSRLFFCSCRPRFVRWIRRLKRPRRPRAAAVGRYFGA